MKRHHFFLVLFAVLIALGAGLLGYTKQQGAVRAAFLETPIVSVEYTIGGLLRHPMKATKSIVISGTGKVVVVKNSGAVRIVETLSDEARLELYGLVRQIAKPEDIATSRPQRSCMSWVDGNDVTLRIYANSRVIELSNCDWIFDGEHPFLSRVFDIVRGTY